MTALMAILRSLMSGPQCANFTVMDVDVATAALVVTCTYNNPRNTTVQHTRAKEKRKKSCMIEGTKNKQKANLK